MNEGQTDKNLVSDLLYPTQREEAVLRTQLEHPLIECVEIISICIERMAFVRYDNDLPEELGDDKEVFLEVEPVENIDAVEVRGIIGRSVGLEIPEELNFIQRLIQIVFLVLWLLGVDHFQADLTGQSHNLHPFKQLTLLLSCSS